MTLLACGHPSCGFLEKGVVEKGQKNGFKIRQGVCVKIRPDFVELVQEERVIDLDIEFVLCGKHSDG